MSLQDTMARMLEIGYSFSLDNDKIKFHYERSEEPPEEARGLLIEIKTHKEEVLTLLRPITREPEPGRPGVKMAPVKIFSKLFGEVIWLVADQQEMAALVSQGVKEPIYMAWEIPVLRGKNDEHLKAIHQTKKIFPGCALS